ncbi:hypothetical protein AKJ65_01960 [candidate division MSBL1 archaeon SCGC-AAA259E19]|uniref:alpha-L-fucosidase n=1 Tax=candidate division MSBL1 archaeon SCGC-AAA259E19 TaxID=1698264 RepID=A0A133UM88_9EURY|nr:hypothetical protein AKJ65_01960 [candidate division MSBL1 archaeon SCGC-AAA259E19]
MRAFLSRIYHSKPYLPIKYQPSKGVKVELVENARKHGLRVGLYYNLRDRHEPGGNSKWGPSQSYVENYMLPQMKELIQLYEPVYLWSDGAGHARDDTWHSQEIVAWYYSWAENHGREVLVNDRWGSNHRIMRVSENKAHGDVWTPEHQTMKGIVDHKWESAETSQMLPRRSAWAYKPSAEFKSRENVMRVFLDIVSKGGNLLFNIGPKADGSIPGPAQQLLLTLGDWLEVNGEAIYGTEPRGNQQQTDAHKLVFPDWAGGKRKWMWEQVVEEAENEGPVYFTVKGPYTYAIHYGWPGENLVLHNIVAEPKSAIRMLGVDENLTWWQRGDDLIIQTPAVQSCDYAYSFKIKRAQH